MTRELELEARRNKGKRLITQLCDHLTRTLEARIDPSALLELDESDRLFSEYSARFRECQEQPSGCLIRRLDQGNPPFELALANELAHALDDTVILFPSEWEYTGAVRVQAGTVLRRALHFLEVDGEEIRMMTPDGANGLLLELYTEPLPGRSTVTFRLWLWGSRWLSAMRP